MRFVRAEDHFPVRLLRENDDYDNRRTLIATIVFALIGNGSLMAGPIAVGAMVDELRFTESQAGFVFTAEYFGLAIGCLIPAFRIDVWNRRQIALAGIMLFVLGNVTSCYASTYAAMLSNRLLEGVGAGLANAAFFSTAAGTRDPDKVFGAAFAGTLLYSGAAVLLSPYLIAAGGIDGLFSFLALFGVLSLTVVSWIPRRAQRVASPLTVDKDPSAPALLLGAALFTMFLLFGGHAAIWAYQERLGMSKDLDRDTIALVIGASTFVGFLASTVAAWTGLRFGRIAPPVIGFGMAALGTLLVLYAGTFNAFLIGSFLILAWFYGLPYVMGIISRLDPRGRAATFSFFIAPVGGTIGPFLAASVIEKTGYTGVFWIGVCSFLLCIALTVPVAFVVDREDMRKSSPSLKMKNSGVSV